MSETVTCKLAPRQLGRQNPDWRNIFNMTGVIEGWVKSWMMRDFGFLILSLISVSVVSQLTADTISSWGFNYTSTPTAGTLIYSDEGNASLTYNYADTQYQIYYPGIDLKQVSVSDTSKCLLIKSAEANDGKQMLVNCSTIGFTDIQLSFATQRSAAGVYQYYSLYYSTDNGATFSNKIERKYTEVASWDTLSYDLSGIQSINNLDNVVFKLTLYSVSDRAGHNRIDNLKITGIPIEKTLPCELHSFAAIPGYQNSVNLSWITHSETGLLGFKLYRNNANDLNSAVQISSLISASNSSVTQTYSFSDTELDQEGTYYYWLETIEGSGLCSYTQPVTILWDPGQQPESPIFYDDKALQAYPNPFNPDTTIHYELSRASSVTLEVFNSRGQKIRSLEQASRPAGSYSVIWDGRTDAGQSCASGIYRLVLLRDKKRSERRVVLLK